MGSEVLLLAVPNVSEGRDLEAIAAIAERFAGPDGGARVTSAALPVDSPGRPARLLDQHSDPDHNRSVFTLAGPPGTLAEAIVRGAAAVVERIDVMGRSSRDRGSTGAGTDGQHPHVGALDVAPIVYLDEASRGAACAEALLAADRIGFELGVPVFLYGELSGGRTRAELRRGGVHGLAERVSGAETAGSEETIGTTPLRADFGPSRLHPTAGATLIAARGPLVAFNLNLGPSASIADARAIAARVREGGSEGLPGVRAIGVARGDGSAQVSMNIERPLELSLASVARAVATHAPLASAELVGLAPSAALEGFPEDLPLVGFDPERHVLENALRSYRGSGQA